MAQYKTCFDERINAYTVLVKHADGEVQDLNAEGEPIACYRDLVDYIKELYEQSAYSAYTMDCLIAQLSPHTQVERWVDETPGWEC